MVAGDLGRVSGGSRDTARDGGPRSVWPAVWRAVSCHRSQVSAYEPLNDLTPAHHEGLWGYQSFYRVFSTVNGGRAREADLFEGIRS
jgi:hypothetical protein